MTNRKGINSIIQNNISNTSNIIKGNNCKDYWRITIINIGRKVLSCLITTTLVMTASLPVQAFAESELSGSNKCDTSISMVNTDASKIYYGAYVGGYNEQNLHLVIKLDTYADGASMAEETGGIVVRKSALNYITIEYDISLLPVKEELRQKILGTAGVISAEWSNTYKIADSVETDFSNSAAAQIQEAADPQAADPQYSLQWAIQNIRADKAWGEGVTGSGITVAVIDTGVDLEHSDLKGQLVQGYNAITGSTAPGAAQDDNGHGTSVASSIAAGKNGTGIVGIAYGAKIMPVKAMDSKGDGQNEVIADGVVWAADHGARIINLSLGAEMQTSVLDEALDHAIAKGCLIVAAAGNIDTTTGSDEVAYPGAYPGVIAVSAIDANNTITDFSRVGPEIQLAAPGKRILADYWSRYYEGEAYSTGTSIAATMVSGSAALLWSKYPSLSAEKIKQILFNSANDLGVAGRDNYYGYGKIDCYRALKLAEGLKQLASPAVVSWEGGRIISASAESSLNIPAGTFNLGIDEQNNEQSMQITLEDTPLPGEMPEEILPAAKACQISWEQQEAHKPLTISLEMIQPQREAQDAEGRITNEPVDMTDKLAYIYKWSAYRWIRIGGGIQFTAGQNIEVPIYEAGTYTIGYIDQPTYSRISGDDRIQTAVKIAQEAYPTGADTVIIARADDYPDALAGVPLAYKLNAPILLTYSQTLPQEVYDAIGTLAPSKIYILGGTGAVSKTVEYSLNNLAYTDRIAGKDRFGTAAAIAEELGNTGDAIIVNASNYPDAIAVAAHAAISGKPILLTGYMSLNITTEQELRHLAVTETEVIGGNGVISSQLVHYLPSPERISGTDRYDTSASLLQAYPPQGRMLYVATGRDFPDALTGGVLAATGMANILLLPAGELTKSQMIALSSLGSQKCIALGGNSIISENILQGIGDMLK